MHIKLMMKKHNTMKNHKQELTLIKQFLIHDQDKRFELAPTHTGRS